MGFKEMDPELARRAIEGYEDVLTPALEEQAEFYRKFSCPRCKGPLSTEFDPRTCYDGDAVVAKGLLVCGGCGYRIEPHTGMVVNFGDASKTPAELIPIIGGKYIEDP